MKTIKCIGIMLLVGLFAFSGSAFAATITDATLSLTTEASTVAPGGLVDFPVTIDTGDGDGDLGGVAFSVTYNAAIFKFGSTSSGTLTVKDPTTYCTDASALTGCASPYDTDPNETVFCVANPDDTDDTTGTAKIACASATAMSGTIVIQLQAKDDVAVGTEVKDEDVTLGTTTITNSSAGYDGSEPLPVLVGMPDDTGTPTNEYEVAPANMTTSGVTDKLVVGGVTKGDPNDDEITNILDLSIAVGKMSLSASDGTSQFDACDMNSDGIINILDLSSMVQLMQ